MGGYRGFITSCKEDLSVKRRLAVTNVSNHWYLFTQWSIGLHSTVYSGLMSSCREAIETLMNTVHYESLALRVRVILTSSGALA